MKILHLSTSDYQGGAARAAYRIHRALVECGIDSRMRVLYSGTDDDRVKAGARSRLFLERLALKFYDRWLDYTRRGWYTENTILHTFGYNSSGLLDEINHSDADVLNLHWISNLLSVSDIGRLNKPLVWRLADMWAFCGGEHYVLNDVDVRFREGYRIENRPLGERGPDLNRRTWELKCRLWAKQHFTVVCTTRWLAECARKSVLFAGSPIKVIPNTLDLHNTWNPIDRNIARIVLKIPLVKQIVLMGADWGIDNPYKGADLLFDALQRIAARSVANIEVVIFGQGKSERQFQYPFPTHWLGSIRDDRLLALAYSAADVMVVPSRKEAFGQTASEAQACGIPVVAFDNSGLADIVIHHETGWLAKAFDTEDLAEGILWVLADSDRWNYLSQKAREQAVVRFSPEVVARQYVQLYQEIIHTSKNKFTE